VILIFILGLVALRILYSVGEVYYERDWPRDTWKGLLIALGLLCIAISAFGQAVRIDIPLQTSGPSVPISGGPLPQALWVANAAAYLCWHPSATLAACQAAPITTYTDSTEGTTCPTATPLVQLPGNTCTAATGTTANVGFWYGGGVFDYWIVSSYGTYGPFSGGSSNSGGGLPLSGGTLTGALTGTSASFSGTVAAGAVVQTKLPAIDPTASAYAATANMAMSAVPVQQVNNPLLATLRTALNNAGTTRVRGVLIGDSILCCTGPTIQSNGPAAQFRSWLQSSYGNGGIGAVVIGDTTGVGVRPEWTLSGTWTTVTDLGPSQAGTGPFGSVFVASGTSNTLTLAAQTGDTVEVYGETAIDSAGCSVKVDGSTVGIAGASTSGTPTAFRSTFAVTLGSHILQIAPSGAGKCYVYAAGFTSGSTGVVLDNLAHGYARSEAWGTTPTAQLAYVAKLSPLPSFAVVGLGVNDTLNGTDNQATYQSNMQAVITGLLSINPSMTIIVMDENDVRYPGNTITQPQIRQSEISLAQSNNLGYTSLHDSWVSFSNANALGLMMPGDPNHPSDAGGIAIGYQLASYIYGHQTGVVSPPVMRDVAGNLVQANGGGFLSNCAYDTDWYYPAVGTGCIGFYPTAGGGGLIVVAPNNTANVGATITPVYAISIDGAGNIVTANDLTTGGTLNVLGGITTSGNVSGPAAAGFLSNLYYSGGWKYIDAGYAGFSLSSSTTGATFMVAPINSGAAGAPATPTVAYTIDASGNVVYLGSVRVVGTPIDLTSGGTGATTAAGALANLGGEPALGNPSTTGYVLSSTSAGVRSWIANSGGGTGFNGGAGTSFQDALEIAAPANPASTYDRLYLDSTAHQLKCLTSSGGSCMPSGSGTVTTSGSPVSPNIAAFSSSTAITAATSANIQTAIGASVYDAYGAAAARQANLSLLAGTYINGDMCTYASSGTLLNCNTAVPTAYTLPTATSSTLGGVKPDGTTISNSSGAISVANPYNPASVAITGGTIDGTVIGGTTPAAGTFTSIAATGSGAGSFTVTAGTAPTGAAGQAIYSTDATVGYAEVNENNTGLSRVCTAANGQCTGSSGLSGMNTGQIPIAASATTVTSSIAYATAATASTIVERDSSNNINATTFTGALSGNATTATSATSATSATTATNTAGGAVGSAPYQSAAGTTAFIASPTTTGHYFVYSWQPTGSAIDPVALDLATWFSAQTYGGTLTSSQVTAALTFTPVAPGANSSITSLSGLTTPLSVAQGGTGLATLTAHAVQVGNGTSSPAQVGPDSVTTHFLASGGSSSNPTFRALASGDIPATAVPAVAVPTPGTSITLAAPSGFAICTGTCTVSVPVPAAGYQFCILNDDNVSTAITLSALGSSAQYENSARTAYGTAGTGTLVLSAAPANMVCIVGRDSTHYLTTNYVGTVTVN
jgi:hypothetical protein